MNKEKLINNKRGASLLEMVVAVAIFSVTILAATQIFKMAIEGQRSAIAAQNIQESMRYALEVMSKEIRMAQKTTGSSECGGELNKRVYRALGGSKGTLLFMNFHNKCVTYFLDQDPDDSNIERIKIKRWQAGTAEATAVEDFITPDEINISDLEFGVVDIAADQQARATIKMEVEASGVKAIHKSATTLQTTISSRYYE